MQNFEKVYILSAVRTPIGSFGGALSGFSAVQLGSLAIKGVLEKISLAPAEVDEVFMGNVISANLGQAPARRMALDAGISHHVPCTQINKVCASGMKAIMLGAQSIMLGINDVVVAGGTESMSNIPYYIPRGRYGYTFGHGEMLDGLVKDGLWEPMHEFMMGNCAEHTAREMDISREAQDQYAIESYKRSAEATDKGHFTEEIVPVAVPQKRGEPLIIKEDEEFKKVVFDKIPSLKPVFEKEGTVTAANASTINDGASALVLVSEQKVKSMRIKPIARIRGFADAAQDPLRFTTAPALAIPKALDVSGLKKEEMDYYEINEAFSVVVLANNQLLGLNRDQVNVFGGAVSLGHPLGASGARITTTLTNVLRQKNGRFGAAGICNGGGGASAIVLENLD
jgi:acetyl-CoA C-acetyltransferase